MSIVVDDSRLIVIIIMAHKKIYLIILILFRLVMEYNSINLLHMTSTSSVFPIIICIQQSIESKKKKKKLKIKKK